MKKFILSFLVYLSFAVAAQASTVNSFTINFTGTIAAAVSLPGLTPDFGHPLVGEDFAGSIVFTDGVTTGDTTAFSDVLYSFSLVGGGPASTGSFGAGEISITQGVGTAVWFAAGPGTYANPNPGTPTGSPALLSPFNLALIGNSVPLLSLANFPADKAAALLAFGGSLLAQGAFLPIGSPLGAVFNIDTFTTAAVIAATPLPPAIWLFLSALGGLGWIARRRARAVMAPA